MNGDRIIGCSLDEWMEIIKFLTPHPCPCRHGPCTVSCLGRERGTACQPGTARLQREAREACKGTARHGGYKYPAAAPAEP
ncbi:hypothetical protein U9M48_009000 [Paspalum notatum var. saurae]|uniref:Uncharacterized protein n=1 Tax=Paspalum notatum var. saurae TaxID=547442 RepID=A0AAQ3WEC2_PASNO